MPDLVVLGEQVRQFAAADEGEVLDQASKGNPSLLGIFADDLDRNAGLFHLEQVLVGIAGVLDGEFADDDPGGVLAGDGIVDGVAS